MKFCIVKALVIALVTAATGPVHAAGGTASIQFKVFATLAPTCVLRTPTSGRLDFGTYIAFGSATTANPSLEIKFECSRGMTPTGVSFDTTNGSASAAFGSAAAAGVVAGLQYSLVVGAPAKTSGSVATPNSPGTADGFIYTVNGKMSSGQAGCSNTTSTAENCTPSQTRTLTITY
jgi:hypothetical protein